MLYDTKITHFGVTGHIFFVQNAYYSVRCTTINLICAIDFTDQINLKDLNDVMRQEARGIAIKWYTLGVELLDGHTAVLDVIETTYQSDDNRCSRMFEKWLEMKPDASWSQLVIALNNIGLNFAADNVYHSKISKEG